MFNESAVGNTALIIVAKSVAITGNAETVPIKIVQPSKAVIPKQESHVEEAVLPSYVRALLASCPKAGTGVHRWLFSAAKALHRYYPDKAELAQVIEAACTSCGRDVPEREIWNAIENSSPEKLRGKLVQNCSPHWPKRNAQEIERIVRDSLGTAGLAELSPIKFSPDEPSRVEEVIDLLFPGNPLLCVGKSSEVFNTRLREDWRGSLANKQLIVPSPMTAVYGKTKDGRPSKHTLDNTGPRRFLVVEFDPPKFETLLPEEQRVFETAEKYYRARRDEQASLLLHLAQHAPLTMAVFSGSKSIHGWFYCLGQPEETLLKFMRSAVSLGADRATWTKSQFVRLAEGQRDNGKRQNVLFLNPSLLPSIDKDNEK